MLIRSDARHIPLADESVHCVVTSPPYWGLRAYKGNSVMIGLEPTFEEHLENLVAVFREVRRVLRKDGTLWLNYGDAHSRGERLDSWGNPGRGGRKIPTGLVVATTGVDSIRPVGTKPKDLMMMPARVAMALQADGWWLRQKIPWLKRNPMPESTQDRPGSSLEFVYLLAKSGNPLFWAHPRMHGVRTKPDPDYFYVNKKAGLESDQPPDGWREDEDWKRRNRWKAHDYFYDGDAVRVRLSPDSEARYERGRSTTHKWADGGPGDQTIAKSFKHMRKSGNGRSFRNTDLMFESIREPWGLISEADGTPLAVDVTVKGFKGAHFATFPEKLVTPFIKAGTSAKGCCPECGAPWKRQVESELVPTRKAAKTFVVDARDIKADKADQGSNRQKDGHKPGYITSSVTTGWSPTCDHAHDPIPCTVLDPFAGSGTTVRVATRFNRRGIGCDLDYQDIAKKRTSNIQRSLI